MPKPPAPTANPSDATETPAQSYMAAFVQALRQLGWLEGQNVRIDTRWSAGDAGLARIYAAQLIGLMPDVIVAASTANLTALQQATSTVPIVFVQVSDPVEQGFVTNVTRPGGNLTGFSMFEFSVGGKWLELLKEIAPDLARVGVMFNPDTSPQSKFFMRSIEAAAPSHGVQVIVVPVRATASAPGPRRAGLLGACEPRRLGPAGHPSTPGQRRLLGGHRRRHRALVPGGPRHR